MRTSHSRERPMTARSDESGTTRPSTVSVTSGRGGDGGGASGAE
jgi:hypothetical protein